MKFDSSNKTRRHHSQLRPGDIMQTSDNFQYIVIYVSKQDARVVVFSIRHAEPKLVEEYRLFLLRNFIFLMSSPPYDEIINLIGKEKTSFGVGTWRPNYGGVGFFDESAYFVTSTIKANPSKGIGNKDFTSILQKDVD